MLYYLVANVGPKDASRPLAVAYRQGRGHGPKRSEFHPERARLVVQELARLINVIREPSNRPAIEAEIALAQRWYQEKEPERLHIPDKQQAEMGLERHCQPGADPANQRIPDIPWVPGKREFPFLSTCLWLGLAHGDTSLYDIHHQPLGTTFADAMEYVMVVIDVSNPAHPRYGIINRQINYLAEVNPYEWDPVESRDPVEAPVPVMDGLSRRTETATDFVSRCRLEGLRGELESLRKFRKIRAEALECKLPLIYEPG